MHMHHPALAAGNEACSSDRFLPGVRIADEAVYLSRRTGEPKVQFKRLGDLLEADVAAGARSLLDVGCATAELLIYLHQRFPCLILTGMDILPSLIERARQSLPEATFEVASILEAASFEGRQFDVVVCSGTIGIFDGPEMTVPNLLSAVAPGGTLCLLSNFNRDPLDIMLRYRRSDDESAPWETGWNVYSRASMERLLRRLDPTLTWSWIPFRMPKDIAKGDDPARTWTISTAEDPHQLVNGMGLLVNLAFLKISRPRP